jgi:hypothetical protein
VHNTVSVIVQSDCRYTAYSDALEFCEYFACNRNREKGTHFALRLAQSIACDQTTIRFRFGDEEKGQATTKVWTFEKGGTLSVVAGSPTLRAAAASNDNEAAFSFVAEFHNLRIP